MRYHLTSGHRALTVEATPPDEQLTTTVTVYSGGAEQGAQERHPEHLLERTIRLEAWTPEGIGVREGAKVSELLVARSAEGLWVWCDGRARLVRDSGTAPLSSGPHGAPGDVTPPMPAVVQEICVALGDHVEQGARLVVLSAMKMETTLVAPRPGRVVAVNVEAGDRVAPGDMLVEIQPQEAGEPLGGENG